MTEVGLRVDDLACGLGAGVDHSCVLGGVCAAVQLQQYDPQGLTRGSSNKGRCCRVLRDFVMSPVIMCAAFGDCRIDGRTATFG